MFSQLKLQVVKGLRAGKLWLLVGMGAVFAGGYAPGVQAVPVQAVAAGFQHSCAITTSGGAMCWGYNAQGQLGDGTVTNALQPVNVVGLTSGVAALALGNNYSCAIMMGGNVKCWGENSYGQLGNGTTTKSNTPVDVANLSGVISLASGQLHTCAALATGEVKCWGYNAQNQIGDGTATNRLTPTLALGVRNIVAVATGQVHTCALVSNNTVQCWGYNYHGQLGNGTTNNSSTSINVPGLSDANAIVAGVYHTCVKTMSGGVKCWGHNAYGQIGNGVPGNPLLPTAVTGLSSGVIALSVGGHANSTCAILATGDTYCWGYNGYGQLGTGDTTNKIIPVRLPSLTASASAMALGNYHSCALVQQGVQCLGYGLNGQLGANTTVSVMFPVDVIGLSGAAPSIPTLISPITTNTPLFTWKATPGATAYRLNLNGTITTYTAAAANCGGGIGYCTVQSAALTLGQYTWYVQSVNSFGSSAWSTPTIFSF